MPEERRAERRVGGGVIAEKKGGVRVLPTAEHRQGVAEKT